MINKVIYKTAILFVFILSMTIESCEKPTRYCVECDCLTRDKCYSDYDRAEQFANTMELALCDCNIYED